MERSLAGILKNIRKQQKKLANKRILLFFAIYLLFQVVLALDVRGYFALPVFLLRSSDFFLTTILAFLVVSVIVRLTDNKVFNLFDEDAEIEQRIFFTKMYSLLLYAFAVIFILYKAGVSLSNMTLLVGIIATGFAFAVREILLAYFVWMVLLVKKPFRIGDYIKIGDDVGVVLRVGTFYVTLDGGDANPSTYIKVPNKVFLDKSAFVYGTTHVLEHVRVPLERPLSEERLRALSKRIRTLVVPRDEVAVSLDVTDKLVLHVSFPAPIETRRQMRTRVIAAVYVAIGKTNEKKTTEKKTNMKKKA